MRIAIWGTKRTGIELLSLIEESEACKIICFVDNKPNENKEICGKCIWSFEELKEKYGIEVDTILISARNSDSIMEILNQLRENSITKVGVVKLFAIDYRQKINILDKNHYIYWIEDIKKPVFWYLQAILTKTCNLKCKGCSHFANLHEESDSNNIYDFEKYKHDIDTLSKKTEIFRLRLLGGEPLLLNNIEQYINYSRSKLPNADIRLVTNGLLFLQKSESLFENIYLNNIGIEISPYPPTLKMMDKIVPIFEKYHIKYSFNGYELKEYEIYKFAKNIELSGNNNPYNSMKSCFSRGCRTIFNGKLYKCPIDTFINKLFDYFSIGTVNATPIEICNKENNWENIIKKLFEEPVESCRYCSSNIKEFNWKIKNYPELSDWIV